MRNDSGMRSHPPTGFATAVGRRLRALREARGLSLSALARQAGIGKATLSGLETGVRNPTLETLYAVTGQLGVPLAAVLGPPAADGQRAEAGPVVVHGAAVEATLLEVFDDPTATYELYRLRIRPGATQTSPAHPAGVTEHVTVFWGVLHAGPAGAALRAEAGEHLSWASDVPHSYAAGPEGALASLLIRSPVPPERQHPAVTRRT